MFESLECEDLVVQTQVNFARHNGLYEYTDCTLPLWANMYVKEKIEPSEGINLLNFSMIPYYSVFKMYEDE